VDGFYPGTAAVPQTFAERAARLVLNHYLMSFGMYWAHRALHVVPYLWRHIHSIHHYASTPLSRVTYQDHWFDNFGNAVVGQTFAQILIPLDLPTFVFSRLFRVAESLEKHSGHSSNWNLAHAIQFAWMPFAQMPHHHDWHHEGFKSCNYTFSSMGGVWDWVFGTRRAGRAANEGEPAGDWATKEDKVLNAMGRQPIVKSFMDTPICVVLPDVALGVAAAYKLWLCGGTVCAA
jgi:sterol desaturase/sphingolipid hydroxylase (fatty acid hydroxylase superfamily)